MPMQVQQYAVVIPFSLDRSRVLLICKNRPDWQRGRLNGPGGHVEPGERCEYAACRELWEETGLEVSAEALEPLVIMGHPDHHLEVFTVRTNIGKSVQKTDEVLVLTDPRYLPANVMRSIRWWIGLALDDDAIKPIVYRDRTGREESHEG